MFKPETILERFRERPFQPVRIIVSEGQRFDVYHPDMVWVGERDIQVGKPSSRNLFIYVDTTRIALIHVVALEDLAMPTSTTTNGRPAPDT